MGEKVFVWQTLLTRWAAAPIDMTRHQRYTLLPKWIRFFSWLFVLFFAAPLSLLAGAFGTPVSFSFLGLYADGSPFTPMALLIQALMLFFAYTAYTLLLGRWIGVRLGVICGYAGLAIVLGVMASVAAQGNLSIRLDPLLQIPFIIVLTRLRRTWEAADDRPMAAPSITESANEPVNERVGS